MNLFEFLRKNNIKTIYSLYEFGGWADCEINFSEKEVSYKYFLEHEIWKDEEEFAREFAKNAKTLYEVMETKEAILDFKNKDKSKDIKIDFQERKINNSKFTTEKDLVRKLSIFYNSIL